jgi:site-specific DNA-cytosine methylase
MIAGSSCVDYSSLNSSQKEFGQSGESYDTLMATLAYAVKHEPTIVILENVQKFPWDKVEQMWRQAGYATQVAYLDSKDFYLPQTRQRGYMMGLRRAVISERNVQLDADIAPVRWFDVLESLQRRASSPFTDFVYADDDPQLPKAEQAAAAPLNTSRYVEWDKCKLETLTCRSANNLGFRKPLTDWENNGTCRVPDHYAIFWWKPQVERIWETMEINFLRSITQRGFDLSFKA